MAAENRRLGAGPPSQSAKKKRAIPTSVPVVQATQRPVVTCLQNTTAASGAENGENRRRQKWRAVASALLVYSYGLYSYGLGFTRLGREGTISRGC